MEPVMEKLDINSTSEAFEDYFERFEIWAMTMEDDEDVNIVAHFLTFIGKEAYSLLRTLAMPEKPISLPYTALKELLLDYCFKCGDIRHIQSVCNTNVHLIATNIKTCNSDSTESSIYNDHLSLSTIAIDNVESQNADFSNDPLICNGILNEFEETITEESSLDVIPNIICPHNSFSSCGKLVQCEARVLNKLHSDYNSDYFTSIAVNPYHKFTSHVYSNQCEKYVLNEATLFITWRYKDPTLFRGGG
ncbi:unnamed protein product [Schistosoma curassoni]|uniref:CCHC-type domain-containing protein n=1 Tax=Schistosoma curassoni TaxID=6186 RepID=A0A183KV92_9TREM|nr:unnamed protein product [Schistosoma curassoni]